MAEGMNEMVGSDELERRAIQFEGEQRLLEARDAFDAALLLNPGSQSAAEGRARIAIQLREEHAAEHCARALAYHTDDPELQLQMIATAAVELGSGAISLLETFVDRYPLDVGAHELLADIRAQAGQGDSFINSYEAALAKHPDNLPLLKSYWSILSRSGRHLDALQSIDATRTKISGDRELAMLEIAIAGHAGQIDRASRLLDEHDDGPDAQLARGLNRLQSGRPDEAAQHLEAALQWQPDNLEAWALLELAWRASGNPRHDWLIGQPGLYRAYDLDLSGSQLADVASLLRTLHRTSAQPIGQSVRGGTQTAGQLFLRDNPELLMLLEALATAIRKFVNNLPPADPFHPLLKHRDMPMAFGPSWSVRLTGGGFHAAHFHPGGILSSACYISLPHSISGDETQAGWLEIGRPPVELGLDLPALEIFEPRPGRLVLFPSFLFHGTRPFREGERLTVAFDIVPVTKG